MRLIFCLEGLTHLHNVDSPDKLESATITWNTAGVSARVHVCVYLSAYVHAEVYVYV